MAGLANAGHTEIDPDAEVPLLILAACPVENRPAGAPRLWGGLSITVLDGTLAFRVYKSQQIEEAFTCNYELNPLYRAALEKAGLKVSGISRDGGARIIELPRHRFFLATGYVPQLGSEENRPHPLIVAFLKAALE